MLSNTTGSRVNDSLIALGQWNVRWLLDVPLRLDYRTRATDVFGTDWFGMVRNTAGHFTLLLICFRGLGTILGPVVSVHCSSVWQKRLRHDRLVGHSSTMVRHGDG